MELPRWGPWGTSVSSDRLSVALYEATGQLSISTWLDDKGAYSPGCFGGYRRYVIRKSNCRRE